MRSLTLPGFTTRRASPAGRARLLAAAMLFAVGVTLPVAAPVPALARGAPDSFADLAARLQVGWAHIDWALGRHERGLLTASEASAAKLWHTEMLWEACDQSLQLHGGAGYMNEYPIARLWRDARVQRIYGGTNEIMKEVIGRSL